MKAIYAVPATLALVYRAYSRNSLTPAGIAAATLTAVVHAMHPWNMPFVLLAVFFLAGSRVTHTKHEVKAKLTMAAQGSSTAGEGPRTHIQVFANSIVATVFTLLHTYQLAQRKAALLAADPQASGTLCFSWPGDVLIVGIIANYACCAADTFSSELGILSRHSPRLIVSPTFRRVPPGTNGGVTLWGLVAGGMGSMIIVTAAMLSIPACASKTADGQIGGGSADQDWSIENKRVFMMGLLVWGLLGSVLDSILGALLQSSVRDVRSGKIVEGEGGQRVLVAAGSVGREHALQARAELKAAALHGEGNAAVPLPAESKGSSSGVDAQAGGAGIRYDSRDKDRSSTYGDDKPSRVVESGWDLLDNNEVNFVMALSMSVGAVVIAAWYWGVPLREVMAL